MRLEFKSKLTIKDINTLLNAKMNEELKEDSNCIIKAFENNNGDYIKTI